MSVTPIKKYYIDSPSEIIECEDGFRRVIVSPVESHALPYEEWYRFNVHFENKAALMPVMGFVEKLCNEYGYRVTQEVLDRIEKRQDKAVSLIATCTGILLTNEKMTCERESPDKKSPIYNGPLCKTNSSKVFMLAATQKMFPKTMKGQVVTILDSDNRIKYTRTCDEDDIEKFLKKIKVREGLWRMPTFEELKRNNMYKYHSGRPKLKCDNINDCPTCRFKNSCKWRDGITDTLANYLDDPCGEKMFY